MPSSRREERLIEKALATRGGEPGDRAGAPPPALARFVAGKAVLDFPLPPGGSERVSGRPFEVVFSRGRFLQAVAIEGAPDWVDLEKRLKNER
jgi:hypothetical protein